MKRWIAILLLLLLVTAIVLVLMKLGESDLKSQLGGPQIIERVHWPDGSVRLLYTYDPNADPKSKVVSYSRDGSEDSAGTTGILTFGRREAGAEMEYFIFPGNKGKADLIVEYGKAQDQETRDRLEEIRAERRKIYGLK